MPELIDTQIVSYALKGRAVSSLEGKAISSITANELLLVQHEKPAKANYYVPILSRTHFPEESDGMSSVGLNLNRDHPFQKIVTDQIVMEFGNEYPTIVEYGALAISLLINKKIVGLYNETIKHLDKQQQKTLRKRYNFLLENDITCVPLTQSSTSTAMELLYEFRKTHQLKARFRNSLNDILILATAVDLSANLVTEDSVLRAFAAKLFSGQYQNKDKVTIIDFSQSPPRQRVKSKESKGYINDGWRVRFSRHHYSK